MWVSSLPHTLATLPWGMSSQYPLNGRMGVGSRAHLDILRNINLLPMAVLKPWTKQLVA
jgi:hypothetical protein